ncbi:MAG: D-tyrosyl-tRNA(Tyr) deacylase [Chloroflexi bacterium]|nr:MAG: D-tyrosyl-tRNA(Tyr) deacylase [Chloroflexota bacterium]
MRALIQRVSSASLTVNGKEISSIGNGMVVFLGIGHGDSKEDAIYLSEKIANLRIFSDDEGRFDLSAIDTDSGVLLVSQFTLYADTRKGRRPSFIRAAPPEIAEPLMTEMAELLRQLKLRVSTGVFKAHMMVSLINDGPATFMIDSIEKHTPRKA